MLKKFWATYLLWLHKRRIRQYDKLVNVLNITTDHTAGMKVGNLDVAQYAKALPISDAMMANMTAEEFMGTPLAVMKPSYEPGVVPLYDDVDWDQTKTTKQYIAEMYDQVTMEMMQKRILPGLMTSEIKTDRFGHPTHIVFKLIAVKPQNQ